MVYLPYLKLAYGKMMPGKHFTPLL